MHGELPEIAAALCYKLIKNHAFKDANKRTAAMASVALLGLNSWSLVYNEYEDGSEFQQLIEAVAINLVNIDGLKKWFTEHSHFNLN